MIRILYVHHGKGIGGAPLSLLYLIRGLDRARFHPAVACLHESEASELFRSEGVETHVLRGIRDFSHTNVLWYPWWQLPKICARLIHLPFAIERARRFLAAHPSDIVHLNTSTLLAFGIAARRERRRVVWHVREPLQRGYFGWRRAMVRSIIRANADCVIPISAYDAAQLLPAPNIHVVHNFIDFSVFDHTLSGAAVRDELGLGETQTMVLFLGGISDVKGTRVFVEAALRILAQRDDIVFVVAGAAPDRTLRNALSGSLPYADAVRRSIPPRHEQAIRFIGVRRDVPQLLAASNMLCFPATVPHFARPVIEASAMARPVIASDLGGPQELVLHGETGLLVPPRDPGALAAAVAALADDQELARRMGRNGIAFARERFDAARNTARIIELYDGLFSGGFAT